MSNISLQLRLEAARNLLQVNVCGGSEKNRTEMLAENIINGWGWFYSSCFMRDAQVKGQDKQWSLMASFIGP